MTKIKIYMPKCLSEKQMEIVIRNAIEDILPAKQCEGGNNYHKVILTITVEKNNVEIHCNRNYYS